MIIECKLEKFDEGVVYGWVKSTIGSLAEGQIIRATHESTLLAEDRLSSERKDLKTEELNAFSFKLELLSLYLSEKNYHSLVIEIKIDGNWIKTKLSIWRPLQMAMNINELSLDEFNVFINHLESDKALLLARKHLAYLDNKTILKNRVCLIAYANNSSGWFNYFYRHYKYDQKIDDIYIITPSPDSFEGYELAGIIGINCALYNDSSICNMLTSLSNGLRSYYEWVICCDVDEILLPHPYSEVESIKDFLSASSDTVIFSRGVDIIQCDDEADFDIQKAVTQNRRIGFYNTALCKPHISRVPLRYGEGQHFCSERPHFQVFSESMVCWHLKWACKKIRSEVAAIVRNVPYGDIKIREYSERTVAPSVNHPGFGNAGLKIVDWLSPEVEAFEENHINSISFAKDRCIWRAPTHKVSNFLLKIK